MESMVEVLMLEKKTRLVKETSLIEFSPTSVKSQTLVKLRISFWKRCVSLILTVRSFRHTLNKLIGTDDIALLIVTLNNSC